MCVGLSNGEGKKQVMTVARIVLWGFKGKRVGKVPRHIDGNFRNNKLDNLAWSSYTEIAKINKSGKYFRSTVYE